MKRLLTIALFALLLCSCEEEKALSNLIGVWDLSFRELYDSTGVRTGCNLYEGDGYYWSFSEHFWSSNDPDAGHYWSTNDPDKYESEYSYYPEDRKLSIGFELYTVISISDHELGIKHRPYWDRYSTEELYFTKRNSLPHIEDYPRLIVGEWEDIGLKIVGESSSSTFIHDGSSKMSFSADGSCSYETESSLLGITGYGQSVGRYSISKDILTIEGTSTFKWRDTNGVEHEGEPSNFSDEVRIGSLNSTHFIYLQQDEHVTDYLVWRRK